MRNPQVSHFARGAMIASLLCISTGVVQAQVGSPVSSGDPSAAPAGSAYGQGWFRKAGGSRVDGQVRAAVPSGSAASAGAVRRVQAGPADAAAQPPAPATQPPQAAGPPMVEPGTPGSNTSDLSLPASERAFGGGEPTTSAAATEEAAAEETKKDTRGLLMKAFDVPEDAGWRIFGWIQNSFTGNANGRGNGFELRRQPELQGQPVDGEPVLPHLREAPEAGRHRQLGLPRRQPLRQRLAVQLHAGPVQPRLPARVSSPATTWPSSTASSTSPCSPRGDSTSREAGGTPWPGMKWCLPPGVHSSRFLTCSTTANRSPTLAW